MYAEQEIVNIYRNFYEHLYSSKETKPHTDFERFISDLDLSFDSMRRVNHSKSVDFHWDNAIQNLNEQIISVVLSPLSIMTY